MSICMRSLSLLLGDRTTDKHNHAIHHHLQQVLFIFLSVTCLPQISTAQQILVLLKTALCMTLCWINFFSQFSDAYPQHSQLLSSLSSQGNPAPNLSSSVGYQNYLQRSITDEVLEDTVQLRADSLHVVCCNLIHLPALRSLTCITPTTLNVKF